MLEPALAEVAALALAALHFGIPLAYYWYAKSRWLKKPWSLKIDESYRPRVTIIIPTYNEAEHVARRLDNIYQQDYPRELVEIVVVDSASTDGTPEIVERWIERHKDVRVRLVREDSRRGMVPALNHAIRAAEPEGDILIFTDADALWPLDALRKVVKYLSNGIVGAVSASIAYESSDGHMLENVYRSYYNKMRVAESKKHSTPVHNGPLIAFRKDLIYEMGLLPEYTGNDDSTPASIIAFMGYRAIQVDDVVVVEYTRRDQFRRRVRRAQHLIIHFLKTRRWARIKGLYRRNKDFEFVWFIETWLHVVNPWLILASAILLLVSLILSPSMISVAVLIAGVLLLLNRSFRAWVVNQAYLLIAMIKNVKSVDIAWSK